MQCGNSDIFNKYCFQHSLIHSLSKDYKQNFILLLLYFQYKVHIHWSPGRQFNFPNILSNTYHHSNHGLNNYMCRHGIPYFQDLGFPKMGNDHIQYFNIRELEILYRPYTLYYPHLEPYFLYKVSKNCHQCLEPNFRYTTMQTILFLFC